MLEMVRERIDRRLATGRSGRRGSAIIAYLWRSDERIEGASLP